MVADNLKFLKIIGDQTEILTKIVDQKYWSQTQKIGLRPGLGP